MRLTTLLGIIFGLLAVVGAYPLFFQRTATHCGARPLCLSNLKQQAVAFAMYSGDHDDRLPGSDRWMDCLDGYSKNPSIFHDSGLPKGAYGYAYHRALSYAKVPAQPERSLLVYDSTQLGRNASDFLTSLPAGGRHTGSNNVAYCDTHVGRLAAKGSAAP